jgi:hypothetical protein
MDILTAVFSFGCVIGAKLVAVSTCHGRLVRHLDNRRVRLPLQDFAGFYSYNFIAGR